MSVSKPGSTRWIVALILIEWMTVSIAHDWKELEKPVIDGGTIDTILTVIEQIQQPPSDEIASLSQEADALNWANWLNTGLLLDTWKGQQEFEQSLQAAGYQKGNEDDVLYLWRTDMDYIAALYNESERRASESESETVLTHYHFSDAEVTLIAPFKSRISELISKAGGKD